MEQYLIISYTYDNKLHLTNLISNYNVKELYSAKTLHIHGSYYLKNNYMRYQNVKFEKLEKIKAKVIVYGNCYRMFYKSQFNGVLSNWDVSSVTDMCSMFRSSNFNGVISNWDVSSVTNMYSMFRSSNFNGVISNWDVSSVTDMRCMFYKSKFNGDISNWVTSNVTNMSWMFYKSPAKKPGWRYKYLNEK